MNRPPVLKPQPTGTVLMNYLEKDEHPRFEEEEDVEIEMERE